jgi:hypothetical protein
MHACLLVVAGFTDVMFAVVVNVNVSVNVRVVVLPIMGNVVHMRIRFLRVPVLQVVVAVVA